MLNVELVRAHPNLHDREGVQTNDKCLKTQADFLIREILVLNSPQPSLHKGGIKKSLNQMIQTFCGTSWS